MEACWAINSVANAMPRMMPTLSTPNATSGRRGMSSVAVAARNTTAAALATVSPIMPTFWWMDTTMGLSSAARPCRSIMTMNDT